MPCWARVQHIGANSTCIIAMKYMYLFIYTVNIHLCIYTFICILCIYMYMHLYVYRVERSRACWRELVVHHCNKLVNQVSWTQVGAVTLRIFFQKVSCTAILHGTFHSETFLRISTARTCSFDGVPLFRRLTGFHPVWRNSFICVMWHVRICGMARSCVCDMKHSRVRCIFDVRVDVLQAHHYTYKGIYSMRATMCCRRTVVYIYTYMYASHPVCIYINVHNRLMYKQKCKFLYLFICLYLMCRCINV